jgi:hypothetical protein
MKFVFFVVRPCNFVYGYQVSERLVPESSGYKNNTHWKKTSIDLETVNRAVREVTGKGGLKIENSEKHFSHAFLFFRSLQIFHVK